MLTHFFSKCVRVGVIATLGLVFAAAQADAAALPIYTPGAGANSNTQGGGDFSVGGSFKYTGSGDAITALGMWDQGQNGLASPHALGLWNSSGTLLASITIPAGTGTTLIGEFRYINLPTPVSLTTGAEYVLGEDLNGNDAVINGDGNFPVGYAPSFTYPTSGFNSGLYGVPGSAEPTIDPNGGPYNFGIPYLGPNALFAPVPEPSSIVLMIAGVAAVWFCKKRRSA